MPGGIHPPLELMLSWPPPNEVNPETRPKTIILVACISGPITILLLFIRLWVRIFHQRSPGWDDWVMFAAMIPTMALTVLFPLASEYGFSRHVWDYNPLKHPRRMVNARKYILAIECIFCVASGLIKISILLFYRRLSSRAISNTFKWITWFTIGFIAAYTVALTIAPIVGCNPIEAFWEQVDIYKRLQGYKYDCFNEGADVFAASIISLAQDLLTAILPTFLYWNLQIPARQKIALFGIFAIGYSVVAIGALRAYYSWQIFFETYDVTWATWDLMLITMLELHIGCFCANAPALKVFFKHFFQEGMSSFSRSRSRSNSAHQKSNGDLGSKSNSSGIIGKVASLLSSRSKSGYISEPGTHVSVDTHGGVLVKKDFTVNRPEPVELQNSSHNSISTTDLIYSHYCTDIELADRPDGRRISRESSVRSTDRSVEADLSALPPMPRPVEPVKGPRLPMPPMLVSHSETNNLPRTRDQSWLNGDNDSDKSHTAETPAQQFTRNKPSWQTWA